MTTTIRVAHSPDSDDAFMFYALAEGKIDTGELTYVHELQDIESLKREEIRGTLPYPPDGSRSIVAAPDGRTLYYGAQQVEANIWIVKRQPRGTAAR